MKLHSAPAAWVLLAASIILFTRPAIGQPRVNISDSDFISISPMNIAISDNMLDTNFFVTVRITTATPAVLAITIPLSFAGHPELRIDTNVVAPNGQKGVIWDTLGLAQGFGGNWSSSSTNVNNASQTILIGFLKLGGGFRFPPSSGPLCQVYFDLDASGVSGTVIIDSTLLPPSNHLIIVDTLIVKYTPQWTPGKITIGPAACDILIPLTGDVDQSGAINLVDIVLVATYVFRSGVPPKPCEAAGDFTCDGQVDAVDLIFLVDHFFKGGPQPCDVCLLIPGTWTCP